MDQCICGQTWCQAWNRCPNHRNTSQPHGKAGTPEGDRAQQVWDERGDSLEALRRAVGAWRLVGDRTNFRWMTAVSEAEVSYRQRSELFENSFTSDSE